MIFVGYTVILVVVGGIRVVMWFEVVVWLTLRRGESCDRDLRLWYSSGSDMVKVILSFCCHTISGCKMINVPIRFTVVEEWGSRNTCMNHWMEGCKLEVDFSISGLDILTSGSVDLKFRER